MHVACESARDSEVYLSVPREELEAGRLRGVIPSRTQGVPPDHTARTACTARTAGQQRRTLHAVPHLHAACRMDETASSRFAVTACVWAACCAC